MKFAVARPLSALTSKGTLTEANVPRNTSSETLRSQRRRKEFSQLRRRIYSQLLPQTPLQRSAADSVAAACLRLQELLSQATIAIPNGELHNDLLSNESTASPWNVADPRNTNRAIKFLDRVIVQFSQNPSLREDDKEGLKGLFGQNFVDDLTNWVPTNLDAYCLANHLIKHAKTFKKPLPEIPRDSATPVPDPEREKQMVTKLLTEKRRQLQIFSQILNLKVKAVHGTALDPVTSAVRDLGRALWTFKYIRRMNL